jgi:hypothetical protein
MDHHLTIGVTVAFLTTVTVTLGTRAHCRVVDRRTRGVTAGAETLVGGPVEQALTPQKNFNDLCYDNRPDPLI